MIALGCLWFVFAALLAPIASSQAAALSADENLDFINKVLELLNNQEECIIPTFKEVDDLNLSLNELEELWGEDFESKLSEDQKLLKNTLLDQWESFQRRTSFGVVIRSAKKRSFLCKVESYQKARFGSSICSGTDVIPQPKRDVSHERNPIVRYIKHLELQEVDEGEHQKFEIYLSPISVGSNFSPRGGIRRSGSRGSAEGDESENHKQDVTYDALADIPDVSVHSGESSDSESDNSDTASSSESNPFAFAPREEQNTQSVVDHSAAELERASSQLDFADASDSKSSSVADADSSSFKVDAYSADDSAGDSTEAPEAKNAAAIGAHGSGAVGTSEVDDDAEEAGGFGEAEAVSSVANSEDESIESVDDLALAESAYGAVDDIATTATSNKKMKEILKSRDVVYVDDDTDDKNLIRLTKIKPMLFEFGITYKGFKWPDDSSADEFDFDHTVQIDWNKFVNDPNSCMSDITLFNIDDSPNSRIRGGGSFWAPGPKSEERNAIADWDQAPSAINEKLTPAPSKGKLGKLSSKKSIKMPKFICRSFGKLFSSKKRTEEKKKLMKKPSDI